MDSNLTGPSNSAAGTWRVSGRLLLAAGGFLVANCLVWGTLLLVCGGFALGSLVDSPAPPTATRVAQATRYPRLSPSPIPTRTPRAATPTGTAAPTTWIVNPTASWPTLPTPAPTRARPTYTPTPWPTQVIQGASAEAKVQALLELAAQGPGIPFRVVFTERELEGEIERNLARDPAAPYRNVKVELQPDEAVVAGQVKVGGLWVNVTVHVDVTAQGGKPVLTVTRVDLGPIPLPGSVKEDINRELHSMLAAAERLPFRFTAITLGDGRVTVQGETK